MAEDIFFQKSSKKVSFASLAILLLLSLCCFFVFYIFLPMPSLPAVTFTVHKGDGVQQIAANLEEEGFIRSKYAFMAYVFVSGSAQKLQAGTYEFLTELTIPEIAGKIARGEVAIEKLTIVEGWRLVEIAQALEQKGIAKESLFALTGLPVSEVQKNPTADNCSFDQDLLAGKDFSSGFSFLEDKPEKMNLEGYLFPDTYEFVQDENAEGVVKEALANFDEKLTADLRAEIQRQKKTIFEIVTMASLLEKEVKTLEDKKVVAGILWKRSGAEMPLQVDATVLYSLGRKSGSVSIVDTKSCSPYNTYRFKGLPLGPISNPGLDSMVAAIYPISSSYWYYLSTPEGQTLFSVTFSEHVYKKTRYLK